jgi:hypothetical protein
VRVVESCELEKKGSSAIAAGFASGESVVWATGDVLAFGSWRFGEKYQWAIEHVGITRTQAEAWCYVSRNVPRAIRRPELSHSHHRAVASLPTIDEKERWLQLAVERRWTHRELTEALAALPAPKAVTPRSRKAPVSDTGGQSPEPAVGVRPKRRKLLTDPALEQFSVRLIAPPARLDRYRAKAAELGVSMPRLCAIALDAYCADD